MCGESGSPVFGVLLSPALTHFPIETLQIAFQGRFLQLQQPRGQKRSEWTPRDRRREAAKALFVWVLSADTAPLALFPGQVNRLPN